LFAVRAVPGTAGGRLVSYPAQQSERTVAISDRFRDFDRRLSELRDFL